MPVLQFFEVIFDYQEDDEEGGHDSGEDTRIYLEKLELVHKEYMKKSDDYEKIHNDFVQSEQVSDTVVAVLFCTQGSVIIYQTSLMPRKFRNMFQIISLNVREI